MTMLKRAFVPLQCAEGSRTAIDCGPCMPGAPKPAARVRFLSVPSGYMIQTSPPRGTASRSPSWLPKVEVTVVKSAGSGTWVTKRIGLVSVLASGASRSDACAERATIMTPSRSKASCLLINDSSGLCTSLSASVPSLIVMRPRGSLCALRHKKRLSRGVTDLSDVDDADRHAEGDRVRVGQRRQAEGGAGLIEGRA